MSGTPKRAVAAATLLVLLLGSGPVSAASEPHTFVELHFREGCGGTGTVVLDNSAILGGIDRVDVAWSPARPITAGTLLGDISQSPNVQLFLDDGTLVYAATGVPIVGGFQVLATLDCSTIPYAVVSGLPNTSVGSGPGPLPIALMLFVVAGIIAAWAFARSRRPRPRLAS